MHKKAQANAKVKEAKMKKELKNEELKDELKEEFKKGEMKIDPEPPRPMFRPRVNRSRSRGRPPKECRTYITLQRRYE